ncbi:MAG: hypothetical protein ILO53_04815 [Clostridia bacterium]|nr:hypothetical protein [Clostridia bacterium]
MKLLYIVRHRIAEYAQTGRGLFAALIVTVLFSTVFVAFLYGLAVETVFQPQSAESHYRFFSIYDPTRVIKDEDEFLEMMETCRSFGEISSVTYRTLHANSIQKVFDFIGESSMSNFEKDVFVRDGRTFFEEKEYEEADDVCIIYSRETPFEKGDVFRFEGREYPVIGTIRPLTRQTGRECDYMVYLPHTTYLNSIGVPEYVILYFQDQIGVENENKLISLIKSRWPQLELSRSSQSAIAQNRSSQIALMFVLILFALAAMSVVVNYFDERNVTNDAVLRLIGAERAEIVIYSFITRVVVVMVPVAAALLLFWMTANGIFGTVSFGEKVMRYRSHDYFTIAALMFLATCLALLPYTVKLYVRSARDFAAKRE